MSSSTRIEGAKLSDAEVEKLLSGLRSDTFANRDEQEVAGYAHASGRISAQIDGVIPFPLD